MDSWFYYSTTESEGQLNVSRHRVRKRTYIKDTPVRDEIILDWVANYPLATRIAVSYNISL